MIAVNYRSQLSQSRIAVKNRSQLSLPKDGIHHDFLISSQHGDLYFVTGLVRAQCVRHSLQICDRAVVELDDDVTCLQAGLRSRGILASAADLYAILYRAEIGHGAEIRAVTSARGRWRLPGAFAQRDQRCFVGSL